MQPPFLGRIVQKKPAKSRNTARIRSGKRSSAGRGKRPTGERAAIAPPAEIGGGQWTFLTNHAHVLVILSRDPSLVLRQVAAQVGITERAVQRIIADLEAAGIIEREKVGRQNQYRIHTEQRLRHSNESHRTIGELLALINRA